VARAHIFQVPWDSGHRGRRMGVGPLRLIERGLVEALAPDGTDLPLTMIEAHQPYPTEIGTAFELHRHLALAVTDAATKREYPIVLSGNCNSSIGTVSGLQAAAPDEPVGVLWFDGHGDCNTPDTFTGDFLDAMGLSTLTGRCWPALCSTIPGYTPVPDAQVVIVGGHGMDDGARSVLDGSGIVNVSPREVRDGGSAFANALGGLKAAGVSRLYLHLDVDVIDADYAPANEFAPRGGLLPDELLAMVAMAARHFPIGAACVASYDPACDQDDRILDVATRFIQAATGSGGASREPAVPRQR
jgi:arginase